MASPPTDPTARTAALARLGLPASATGAQIVHAYRRLVRATHPDATGRNDPGTAQQFAAIHDAYQLLTQPGQDSVDEPVQASRARGPGDESATPAEQPPLAPTRRRTLRSRPLIVAGPVVVTPLPERGRPHPRRSR